MKETEESREGATGLSNKARKSNMIRYQLGRAVYHLRQAARLGEDVKAALEAVETLHGARPLDLGGNVASGNQKR